MEHGPSREEGSYLDNHREFMPKHNFKMRCENQLLYSSGFVYVQICVYHVYRCYSVEPRRMRSGSDRGLR